MGQTYKNLRGRLLVLFRGRPRFRSSGEIFAAVERLICALESCGFREAAASARVGYASLNGLTDGWADFMDAMERAESELPGTANPELKKEIRELAAAGRFAVYGFWRS